MKILYCGCEYCDIIEKDKKQSVYSALASSGMDVVAIPDLCQVAAKERNLLKDIAVSGELAVVACFPRAVKALFDFAGLGKKVKLHFFNMRTSSAEEILGKLKVPVAKRLGFSLWEKCATGTLKCRERRPSGRLLKTAKQTLGVPRLGHSTKTFAIISRKGLSGVSPGKSRTDKKDWIPWFPVIEYGRCVNCRQCLSFCLFGVYELSKKGKVTVAKPENCKTNCPACAKVCPKSAIIFPKYSESPVNGDEIDENSPAGKNMKIDYAEILGDDAYAVLQQRRRMAAFLNGMNAADGKPAKKRLLKKSK
ncbi:MAG: 4Fe-4S dicluster domain-containing protein [Victivallales bacterium]